MMDRKLNILIVISMILFLLITRAGEHISIPMFIILIAMVCYMFSDFSNSLPSLLAVIGLTILVMSLRNKNKLLVVIGYFLTYIILLSSFLDEKLYERLDKEIYFLSTTFVYLVLSGYVILKTLQIKSIDKTED